MTFIPALLPFLEEERGNPKMLAGKSFLPFSLQLIPCLKRRVQWNNIKIHSPENSIFIWHAAPLTLPHRQTQENQEKWWNSKESCPHLSNQFMNKDWQIQVPHYCSCSSSMTFPLNIRDGSQPSQMEGKWSTAEPHPQPPQITYKNTLSGEENLSSMISVGYGSAACQNVFEMLFCFWNVPGYPQKVRSFWMLTVTVDGFMPPTGAQNLLEFFISLGICNRSTKRNQWLFWLLLVTLRLGEVRDMHQVDAMRDWKWPEIWFWAQTVCCLSVTGQGGHHLGCFILGPSGLMGELLKPVVKTDPKAQD